MNIGEMESGPELDALIAEKVMGLERHEDHGHSDCSACDEARKKYSTDIAVAWEIVEKLKGKKWLGPEWKSPDTYMTQQGYPLGTEAWYVRVEVKGLFEWVFGATAPLAICRAALKAVGA